ncbi:DUF2846 domain-containing protein [Pseudomonas citronellolis]|uniref:DUF2846 domain-containing protein n=1 Tax=Pseudomonas citronellolis TaxID=53408 RepID=UPI0023E37721|nr:DUF2846 domain-containing protein [Pseudomonas citronellolis]MDF3937045.1 DUF2846 domain-containing protein [Pseudomonas citronellolis]
MTRSLLGMLFLLLAGCSTPGAFFGATDGQAFAPLRASDAQHAVVYLYRPQNKWADEELEAPGLFLNNELIGSLPSKGYLALEFEPGSYKLEMRRPLMGGFWTWLADGPMDFTRISSFVLDAKPGGVYYLRYDEDRVPGKRVHSDGDGPLQLIEARLAEPEIAHTVLVQEPAQIAASGYQVRSQKRFWDGVGEALDKVGI